MAADQRIFWTREPRFVQAEFLAKLAIVVGLVLVAWWMAQGLRVQFGMGQGYAVGFPILAGAVLWQTAEKLTRKKPYFRAGLFWGLLPAVLALPCLLAAVWPFHDGSWTERWIAVGVAVVFLLLGGMGYGVCRLLGRWRDAHVLRAQTRSHSSS